MLLIILIGAALSDMRPEPPLQTNVPADPDKRHPWRPRTCSGVAAFWS